MRKKNIDNFFCNGYSIEEIMKIEDQKYIVQIGSDLLASESGKMVFSKDRAEQLFDQALEGLNGMKESEDEIEKQDAIACLQYLRIHPFRMH